VDASATAGVPRARARIRYSIGGAHVTLKRMRRGGTRVRNVVRAADLGGRSPAFVSASVQIGTRSFASALSCSAGRRGRFTCH
jgi:hypothetical protein